MTTQYLNVESPEFYQAEYERIYKESWSFIEAFDSLEEFDEWCVRQAFDDPNYELDLIFEDDPRFEEYDDDDYTEEDYARELDEILAISENEHEFAVNWCARF